MIIRGVSFEFRGKESSARWHAAWDRAIFIGSAFPALLWGVAFASIVRGVPLNAAGVYTGNLLTLLNPYALLGGAATLSLFTLHGAIFLALKTTGDRSPATGHRATADGISAIDAIRAALEGKPWLPPLPATA